jgi:hypothetical protein
MGETEGAVVTSALIVENLTRQKYKDYLC